MGLDYYGILNLKYDCDIFDIYEAFRRAVIKYFTTNMIMLRLACEAYEVLSDQGYRALYNHFGEEGLKSGILAQPFVFHGQPLRTVEKFFGTLNPLEFVAKRVYRYDTIQIKQVLLPSHLRVKDPPMYKDLYITLEEVYHGGQEDLLFCRREYAQVKGMIEKQVSLQVPIGKGILTGTKLVFKNQSHQGPVNIPGDVIVIIRDRPHERFDRSGSNLIQRLPVTLKEAFTGMIFTLNTLDGRIIKMRIYPILSNDWSMTVDGEGLPIPNDPDKKGDLILVADIKMPTNTSKFINQMIKTTLNMAEEKGMRYENMEPLVTAEEHEEITDVCKMKAEIEKVDSCA